MDFRHCFGLLVAMALPALAVAAPPPHASSPAPERGTSLIVSPAPQPIGVPVPVPDTEFATRRAWQVTANVVGLARDRQRLFVPTPDGRGIEFPAQRFDPTEGFTIDDDGNIIVDDDPSKVSYTWSGATGSTYAFVAVRRGSMHALIYGPDVRLTVGDEGRGSHWYRDLDPQRVDSGSCANDRLGEIAARLGWQPKDATIERKAAVRTRDGAAKYSARINVLIYYTQAALGRYGNDIAALNGAVEGLLLQLRDALAITGRTSYITVQLAAPPQAIGAYNESSNPPIDDPRERFGEHLYRLRLRDEDSTQEIRRESRNADLAILLVDDVGNPSADPTLNDPVYGLAITQRDNCFGADNCGLAPDALRSYAYGVVSVNTAVQNLTFAHEFGHLMGGVHDINQEYPAVFPGAFADSYGYRSAAGRDIMSDPACIDDDANPSTPRSCWFRYPQFANPAAFFGPFLVPAGILGQADVARTLRALAEPTGNIYPVGENQIAPDLFWDGFEF